MSKSFLRNVIGEYMATLGERHKQIVMVNADLSGTCRNKSFVEKFPKRSFNMGIAEQNMVSFAAGLECEGFIPYVFSMAPFLTMRACEQVRTDVAYGNRNVRMIGVYAGVSGGISGATHWAIEDVAIMAAIPNLAVMEVCDASQARQILEYSTRYEGPLYIRCGVEPVEDIYENDVEVEVGKSVTIKDGQDGVFLAAGTIVQYALEAAKIVEREIGKKIRVVDMYSLKPIDRQAVIKAAQTECIVVAQDHNINGGLGSIVSQVIAEEGIFAKMKIVGIPDAFVPMAHAPYLYKKFGLDEAGLAATMKGLINR